MQKLKSIVALIVLAGAAAFLAVRYIGLPPKIEARPHIGIGQALAEEASKLAGVGGRIVLIAPDTSVFRYPGAEAQLEAFRSALRRANLSVAATNLVKLDPLYPAKVPPGDFLTVLRKQSEADVIVSLMGPPVLNTEQRS